MIKYIRLRNAVILACMGSLTGTASAATNAELEAEVRQLKHDLVQMQLMMKEIRDNQVSKSDVAVMTKKVEKIEITQLEKENSASSVHLAGYGSVNYTDVDNKFEGDGKRYNDGNRFNNVQFAPIFHYQYKDLMLFEAELDITVDENGDTDTELEYATADLLINDNVTLLVGKFLSPIGQFRQNLHPGWINKLPTAPVGFGHDQAAPIANIGAQLRGGFDLANTKFNYATYVGNGPRLEEAHGSGDSPFSLEASGSTSNNNDELTYGGRIGFLPLAGLELGLSAAIGKVAFYDDEEDSLEKNRDYDVLGTDFSYHWKNLGIRGEYIKQKVGGLSESEVDSGSNTWKAWYLQSAYKFGATKWEGVARYGEYDAPGKSSDKDQWVLGVNYLFANNIIGKMAFEFNDGLNDTINDEDTLTLQMTYGF